MIADTRVAEAHQPSLLMTGASDTPTSEPGTQTWPPDWLASYFSPNRLSKEEKVELEHATGPASALSSARSKRKAGPPEAGGKGPPVTDPPIRGSEAEPH